VTGQTEEPSTHWVARAGGAVETPVGAPPRITLIDYTPDQVIEREITDPQQCETFRKAKSITWVNVDGFRGPISAAKPPPPGVRTITRHLQALAASKAPLGSAR